MIEVFAGILPELDVLLFRISFGLACWCGGCTFMLVANYRREIVWSVGEMRENNMRRFRVWLMIYLMCAAIALYQLQS